MGGRGFYDSPDCSTRLPASARCRSGNGCVCDIVWDLSLDSSAMSVHFAAHALRTDRQTRECPPVPSSPPGPTSDTRTGRCSAQSAGDRETREPTGAHGQKQSKDGRACQ